MEKMLWSEPKITEIGVKMTEDNKTGTNADIWSTSANNLCGDLVTDPS